MGEKKVTIMVLKVDLQCEKCYKKVKKVLCKFPQIRDQTYDEKNNQVIVKVVCCSPEKIRDKLCCEGDGAIKRIDILEPKKKQEPEKTPKPKQKQEPEKTPEPEKKQEPEKTPEPEKKQEPEKEPEPEKKPENPKLTAPPFPAYPPVTVNVCCIVCYGRHPGCPCQIRDAEKSKPTPPPPPPPPPVVPANPPVTGSTCCMDCYGGHPGGPCQTGYGYGGAAPYIEYDGYYGRPVYDSYGGGRSYSTSSYCVTRPDCFSEENPQACAIM
ncbi:PREDICTED: vacuolar protein-sorting protein BRO1-like [Fragaria vesca subsp. vesca]|uniref:vacuolar protein-sorting protein BRO1-like n=1 Tax=Fragaria vesca subsp. vesca TaxID=101020 RepID=UPI0002C2DD61|nr:PREDICTED: vacuolar protein-sorting protein BRO1-like [Fragaria vesca subsp. vesca]